MGARAQIIVIFTFFLSGCAEVAFLPFAVVSSPFAAVSIGVESKRENSGSISVVDWRGSLLAGPPESRMTENSVFRVSPDAIVCKAEYVLARQRFNGDDFTVMAIDCNNGMLGRVIRSRNAWASVFEVTLTPVAGAVSQGDVFNERRYGPIVIECKQSGYIGVVDVDDEPILLSCKTYETEFNRNGRGRKGRNITTDPVPLGAAASEVLELDFRLLTLWINP